MQFTKNLFKARISAGLPSAKSQLTNGSGSRNTLQDATSVDLNGLIHIPEDDLFIRESYRRVLDRECDPGSFVDCLEMLRRHTPRRVLLHQLVQSDEARRRGVVFDGLPPQPVPPPARRSPLAGVRHVAFKGYDFLRRAWHAPFVSLDQKLTLILRELSGRIDEVREKSDRSLWTLSEKLDACGLGIEANKNAIANLGERCAALEERNLLIASQMDAHGAALENLAGSISSLTREISQLADVENVLKAFRKPPLLLGGNDIFVTELDGFIIGQPGAEWRMAAFHALRGVMEPGVVRRLQQLLQPGMTFVDIGANIGVITLHAALRVAPNGKVHSFEPTPRTFQFLKDNIQVNGLLESGLIDLHCEAVSDTVGDAQLSIYSHNSGHNTLFGKDGDSRIAVHTVTLDSMPGCARIDVVKIDAEGAEPLILRGMQKTIEANPQIVVLIEFAPAHLRRAGVEPASFLKELNSTGFVIHVIDDATGDLLEPDPAHLVETISANLELTRAQ